MHASGAGLIRRLRTVDEVYMPAFLIGDLKGGHSFEDMHRSLTPRATPDGLLAGGGHIGGGWLGIRD